MMRRTLGLMAIAILIFSTTSNADVSDNGKTECVGRYQISFPGAVEVATNKPAHNGFTDNASFEDGQNAPFTQLKYSGYLDVISPANESDFTILKNVLSSNRDKTKQELLSSNSEKERNLGRLMKPLTYCPSQG